MISSILQNFKDELKLTSNQGFTLLQQIRRWDAHPNSDLLSPTRLHNVTTLERLLVQLEDTERSFDKFWTKHEMRLEQKFQLRLFEEAFRKSQSSFVRHMIYLEENRDIGSCVDTINGLISKHRTYMEDIEIMLKSAKELQESGERLLESDEIKELSGGSLRPKCDELERMHSVLRMASQRRLEVLRRSKFLHEQISVANAWCNKGVELLITLSPFSEKNSPYNKRSFDSTAISIPTDNNSDKDGDNNKADKIETDPQKNVMTLMTSLSNLKGAKLSLSDLAKRLDDFLAVGESLKLDSLRDWHFLSPDEAAAALLEDNNHCYAKPKMVNYGKLNSAASRGEKADNLSSKDTISLITTDTSVLLDQVSVRVSDIKRMCENRKSYLRSNYQKYSSTSTEDPEDPGKMVKNQQEEDNAGSSEKTSVQSPKFFPSPSTSAKNISTRCNFVIDELINTEHIYVNELGEIIDYYAKPFHDRKLEDARFDGIFLNLQELFDFHSDAFLPRINDASGQNPTALAACFVEHNGTMDELYRKYCQNKSLIDKCQDSAHNSFFQECQRTAGHRLPLGAYLLKPVQRITKYQLILKELAKTCQNTEYESDVTRALDCMLNLLQELNASFVQNRIVGYPGDFGELGATLIHGPFIIWRTKKVGDKVARLRRTGKAQRRHLFLFSKNLLFCKVRRPSSSSTLDEYYEFKLDLPVRLKRAEPKFWGMGFKKLRRSNKCQKLVIGTKNFVFTQAGKFSTFMHLTFDL